MNSIAQRSRSLWMSELQDQAPILASDETCEVAVVGAGLSGLTTAYLLAREGRDVLVLDSGPPGGGMTARTTAHLSNALDDRWSKLIALRGHEEATLAAAAHTAAIDMIEAIAREAAIDCDFARVNGHLFLHEDGNPALLEEEIRAAHDIGLHDVRMEQDPFSGRPLTGPRITFPRQARFHPLKYVRGLVKAIQAHGGRLRTAHVGAVKDETAVTITADGKDVRARFGVVATNSPINDKIVIHTKQAPYRTYALAGKVPKGAVEDALYWDTGDPYHYVRLQPSADHDILIAGGEDHKTGQAEDMERRFRALERWTRAAFPALQDITWQWSGQVLEPVDFLGYLGKNPGSGRSVSIITGDSGMGMTHGTLGAMIIADHIMGRANPWAEVFDPRRKTAKAAGTYLKENLNVAAQMSAHVGPGDAAREADVAPGSGAVIRHGLHKIALYRTSDGTLIKRSAICPHAGCIVAWNPFEECWDCPCHGSQFAPDGQVLNGPALKNLSPADESSLS